MLVERILHMCTIPKYRVIVAGSRSIYSYNLIKYYLDSYLSQFQNKDEVQIVSGCAKGPDTLAIQYALEKGYSLKRFPADWLGNGRAAGVVRNTEMAKYATHCIVF